MKLRPKYEHENILDRYMLTNKLIGEDMPIITESLKKYMAKEDIEFLNALPSEVTIYRGTDLKELTSDYYGQSWTLNKEVADFFAYKHYRTDKNRCVIKATIKKEFIYGYVSSRGECECIVNEFHLKNITYESKNI